MSKRSCEKYQEQLATYRDLGPAEWEALQRHVESCPACSRALAAFRYQDRVLGALPKRTPSSALAAGVRARTLDRHHRGGRLSLGWRWTLAATAVVVVMATLGGAATASAEALPGDFLYPVKRAAERVQYTFTTDPLAREEYLQKLMQRRQEEVQRVRALEREVEITFEGKLQGIELQGTEGGTWNIGGLVVQVPAEMWAGEDSLEVGSVVRVRARISESGMVAIQVRVHAPIRTHTPAEKTNVPEAAEPQGAADQPSTTPQPVDAEPQATETPPAEEPSVEASEMPTVEPPTPEPTAEDSAYPTIPPKDPGPKRFLTATPPGRGPRWGLTTTPRIIVPGLSRTPNPPIVPPGQTRTPQPPGQTRTVPPGPGRFLTATPEIVLPSLTPTSTAEPTKKPDKPGRISPTPGPDNPVKPGRISPTPGPDDPVKPGKISPTPGPDDPVKPGKISPTPGPDKPDKPGRISPTPGPDNPVKPGRISPTPGPDKPGKPGKVSPTPIGEPDLPPTPTPTPSEEPYPYPSPTEFLARPNVRVTLRVKILSSENSVP